MQRRTSPTSVDYTFTTLQIPDNFSPSTTLYYPLLRTPGAGELGSPEQEFTGLGITNLNHQAALLRLTAYGSNGEPLGGFDIQNPVYRDLLPGRQIPIIDQQLFGSGLGGSSSMGWVKIESSVNQVAGFFLLFNAVVTELDGADISPEALSSFIYTEIEDQGFTEITIANPNGSATNLTFHLMKADGGERASTSRSMPGFGSITADLFADLFPGYTPDGHEYVLVTSNGTVLPFELLGKHSQFIDGLNGIDTTGGASTLYCPQYAVGGRWHTSLSVVNLDATAGTVSLRFFSEDGVLSKENVPISAHGKIRIDDPEFFKPAGVSWGIDLKQGYVQIVSSGIRLAGSVVFGDPAHSTFSAALPLVSGLQRTSVFSQVASNNQYFTGLAILNPLNIEAVVTVDIFQADGTRILSNPGAGAPDVKNLAIIDRCRAFSCLGGSADHIRVLPDHLGPAGGEFCPLRYPQSLRPGRHPGAGNQVGGKFSRLDCAARKSKILKKRLVR